MSRLLLFSFIASLALFSQGTCAEIYRWVDENGKVRFSDRPPVAAGDKRGNVSTVDIKSTSGLKSVHQSTPLQYKGKGPARAVLFDGLSIKLPDANLRDVRIGNEFTGSSCTQRKAELYWTTGLVDVGDFRAQRAIVNEFAQAGYRLRASIRGEYHAGAPEEYSLTGTLTALRVNTCKPKKVYAGKSSAAAYVKIDWRLTDKLQRREIFQIGTEGSFDGMRGIQSRDGLSTAVRRAYVVATRNLLAERDFVALLSNHAKREAMTTFDTALPLQIVVGDGTGAFRDRVKALKAASVTVRTVSGHGSGVILGDQGHVLSNAHVVGDSSEVLVIVGGIEYKARVLRKEGVRDVALLQISGYNSPGPVRLGGREPQTGDPILVIGTPLDEFYSHTVTKGIISAYRELDGQAYFQTDAAINKGNSGGPVFNEFGELVAIAVAGVFTRGGASLNLNYLIPVNDALKALNIMLSGGAESTKAQTSMAGGDPNTSSPNRSRDTRAESAASDEIAAGGDAYALYQQALQMKLQGNYLKAGETLARALKLTDESESHYSLLRDELYYHLPLARAQAHILAHDHAAANGALKPVTEYLRDHPKRFEYSAQVQAILQSGKFLQQALAAQAQSGLTPVRVMMREYFSNYGHYPESHDRLLQVLQDHPGFTQRYSLREYSSDGQSYRAEFYDVETGRSVEISG